MVPAAITIAPMLQRSAARRHKPPLDDQSLAGMLGCRPRPRKGRNLEPNEVGDTIAESAHSHATTTEDDGFRRRTAVLLGVLGMLLAIASLAGENAMKETVNANILATDMFAFYQARNERQTNYLLAADALEVQLALWTELPVETRQSIATRAADYRATVKRFESDPANGTGKQELLVKARGYEAHRDHAQRQDVNFDYSRALFQIAIVLGSVSIVAASRPLLWLCGAIALVATLFGVNGFLLLMEIPFS
jgi:hypothetical protein